MAQADDGATNILIKTCPIQLPTSSSFYCFLNNLLRQAQSHFGLDWEKDKEENVYHLLYVIRK